MNVFLKKGGIPDSTRYRLATEELWIFLMVAIGQMNTRCMDLVSKRLSKSMETDLYYDRNKTASNHGGKIHNEKAIIRYDTNSFSYHYSPI